MDWSGPRGYDGLKIRIVPSGRVMRYKPCIISGGQTGVDRGALNAALSLDWPCGGTCPEGRRDELGVIPQHYPLTESSSSEWEVRTRINVDNADATLILVHEEPLAGGTRLTAEYAAQKGKPVRVEVAPWDQESTAAWVKAHAEAVLNVAGPRGALHIRRFDASRSDRFPGREIKTSVYGMPVSGMRVYGIPMYVW